MTSRWIRAQLVLILLAAPAVAEDFFVEARPDNTFVPKELAIVEGDSVTWMNIGGFHNVWASDESFRCADGCDGDGGDGSPSTEPWEFTLVFGAAGRVDYRCQPHEFLGMVGTVDVCADRNLNLISESWNTVEVFTAADTITAGQFTVMTGGDVTLRAAGKVVLLDETMVALDGTLTIDTSPTPCN